MKCYRLCKNCGKEIYKRQNQFCDSACSATYNNKKRILLNKELTNKKRSDTLKRYHKEDEEVLRKKEENKEKYFRKSTCPICNKEFTSRKILKQIYCSTECYNNDTNCNFRKCNRDPKNIEERGWKKYKKGYYQGIWCDSSWELAFVVYNIEHNILFTRNDEGFPYTWKGGNHLYYPDFILSDGSYIEIKGQITEKDKAKLFYFKHDIKLIERNKIKTYLKYVRNKYGKDFPKILYDKQFGTPRGI